MQMISLWLTTTTELMCQAGILACVHSSFHIIPAKPAGSAVKEMHRLQLRVSSGF
jgi:hypothetical protein